MRPEQRDFGQVSSVDAEAIGPPGQRRFRMTVLSDGGESAALWLEKEQLAALGTALEQQLVRTDRQRARTEAPLDDSAPPFPLNPSFDARIGQIALAYDESKSLFRIQAVVVDSSNERASFSCAATHQQARRLIRVISRLISAGRPTCPLCGAVIEGEHHCPRSNGHAEVAIL